MFERMLLSGTAGGKEKGRYRGLFNRPIIASDGGVDWYGEVSAEELISGNALASLIGLRAGTAQHSDAGWLHVGLDGTELLIAKRPLRRSIAWDNIQNVDAVFGSREIEIKDQRYKIRLAKGAALASNTITSGWDNAQTHGCEWNRIFYRLTNEVYVNALNNKASEDGFIHLANYSEEDLVLDQYYGKGSYSWCQEKSQAYRLRRGGRGVSFAYRYASSVALDDNGWRPVLERV